MARKVFLSNYLSPLLNLRFSLVYFPRENFHYPSMQGWPRCWGDFAEAKLSSRVCQSEFIKASLSKRAYQSEFVLEFIETCFSILKDCQYKTINLKLSIPDHQSTIVQGKFVDATSWMPLRRCHLVDAISWRRLHVGEQVTEAEHFVVESIVSRPLSIPYIICN